MRTLLTILLLGSVTTLYGQVIDSLPLPNDSLKPVTQNIDFLYQWLLEQSEDQLTASLESSEEITEESQEELIEAYLYYLENPININSEAIVHLEEIGLLNAFQIKAIKHYRQQFGDLIFMEELSMIDELTETSVAVVAPLLYFGKSEFIQEREKITLGKVLTRGQHQIALNFAEKFDGKKHEDYLGGPQKVQLKYTYQYRQKFRIGLVTEKDAGEPSFFDFVGGYLHASNLNINDTWMVKDIVLGDYQLSFGQGLTLWSGTSFGKGGSSLMKRAAGIRPKTSFGESKFFRGAAISMKIGDFYTTAFYSNRQIDDLQESGYHRTTNEIAKRDSIRQQVFGGQLRYALSQFELGFTLYHLQLSTPFEPRPSNYNQFYFQGDRLTAMGSDFRWLLGRTAIFGELSYSYNNKAFAGLIGFTMKPKGYINFSLLYHNYDKRYQSLFNGAFRESSRGQGEEGYYLGLQCAPAPGWDLLAYCDYFRLTWLGSQVYNPSWGQEYCLKITHQPSTNTMMQFRFKAKTKMKNSSDCQVFSHYPIFYTKRSLNFQISYDLVEGLTFSEKAAYSHYFNDDGVESQGYLLCHDVAYKPKGKPYSITFRYALFESGDYNSRISIYENDVLGAFSIPNLSGIGRRAYLLAKVKLFGCLSIYSRIGILLTESPATDLKVEVIWKNRL